MRRLKHILILILFLFPSIVFGQEVKNNRIVPIVVYSPFDFSQQLNSIANGTFETSYYLEEENMKWKVHNNGRKSGAGLINEMFLEAISANEHIFALVVFPRTGLLISNWGIVKDGKITFHSDKGKKYDSFQDLVADRYGSIQLFKKKYLNTIDDALKYNSNNRLHTIRSENEAIEILKNSFEAYSLYNSADTTGIIDYFMRNIEFIMPVDESTGQKIKLRLMETLNSTEPPHKYVVSFELPVYYDTKLLLLGRDIDKALRRSLPLKEYELVQESLMSNHIRFLNATDYLFKLWRSENIFERYSMPKDTERAQMVIDRVYTVY